MTGGRGLLTSGCKLSCASTCVLLLAWSLPRRIGRGRGDGGGAGGGF